MRVPFGSRMLAVPVVVVAMAIIGFLSTPHGTLAGVDEGKAAFAKGLCANCHGANGEGAFGPTLAGRGLTAERVLRQVRTPFRAMPSFRPDQISDEEASSIADYLNSLAPPVERGKARVSAQPGDSAVKQQWIEKGCGQCHGAENIGFMPLWAERGPLSLPDLLKRKANGGRLMPGFREDQVSDSLETEFHEFLNEMLAARYPVSAGITAMRNGTETTFSIMVHNNGDEAVAVEVKGVLPQGAKLIDSWAGSGRGFNAGKFDGTAVGWINSDVAPGRDQGPFVFIVDTGSEPASSYVWVRYNAVDGQTGAYTSRPAIAAAQ